MVCSLRPREQDKAKIAVILEPTLLYYRFLFEIGVRKYLYKNGSIVPNCKKVR